MPAALTDRDPTFRPNVRRLFAAIATYYTKAGRLDRRRRDPDRHHDPVRPRRSTS